MQNHISCTSKTDSVALPARISPFLQIARSRGRQNTRIVLPAAPRSHLCAVERKQRAALAVAELAYWNATGGDFLRSTI